MSLWVYAMFLITPASAVVALLPLRRVREEALAGNGRQTYLLRVFFLVLWCTALVVVGVRLGSEPGAAGFCLVVFGPGLVFVLARLSAESRHLRKIVARHSEKPE